MWKILSFFWLGKVFNSVKTAYYIEFRNAQVTFAEKSKKNNLNKQKRWYLIHTWSEKAVYGNVVNLWVTWNYAYSPFKRNVNINMKVSWTKFNETQDMAELHRHSSTTSF